MKDFILDIHTHSIASGHAYGTIREMAQAASERKLRVLGVSEHAPGIPGTTDPIHFTNLSVIPRTLYGVHIIHGCEINIQNDGTLSLSQRHINFLDYAIIGLHSNCYKNEGARKNTENVISCMKNEKVHFVSHPDDGKIPLDYEKLVLSAKENQVALEVNNSSIVKKAKRLNCIENYYTMLALCMEYQVPIIVSSDAHDPSWVGEFSLARKLLEEIHFDENLILNTDMQKFEEFIGYHIP